MFDSELLNSIARGMKGNADALLAFFCVAATCGLVVYGVDHIFAFGGPLTFFALYIILRLRQKQMDVKIKEIEFDREKEAHRLEFERLKRKLSKRKERQG